MIIHVVVVLKFTWIYKCQKYPCISIGLWRHVKPQQNYTENRSMQKEEATILSPFVLCVFYSSKGEINGYNVASLFSDLLRLIGRHESS